MSQSEVIVGTLLAAFVLWLLMNGRLNAYWALLTGGGTSAATPAAGGPPVTSTTPPNAGTSAGNSNVSSFVPGTLQQLGNTWVWKDPNSGATRVDTKPPPGYVPPGIAPGG